MACTDADFAYLRSVVYEQTANALDASRDHLFESRLQRILRSTGLRTLDNLVAALRRQPDPAIRQSIAEAMTVSETSFFRDRLPFDVLRQYLIPDLIWHRASTRRLRFWSAACSTGQEAYSLAMLLRESFPHLQNWHLQIVGTDISAEVVNRAQTGRYNRLEVNHGLPARYLLKYFRRTAEDWEIVRDLRQMCRFQQRNLCNGPMLLEKYDGILLRNAMPYLAAEARQRVLLNIHRLLAPDGFLIFGADEQPDLAGLFRPVKVRGTCYYIPVPEA
jgi:chemotaxis protein methyltransferase CheR